LPQRSVTVENATAGATTTYQFQFDIATVGSLGSIKAEFCANDPIVTDPCVAPAGFDISAAVLSAQSGETGFAVDAGTTSNELILSRPTGPDSAQTVSYTLDNVTNPSSDGAYYVRLFTYASNDASGAYTDHGGLAFAMNATINVSSFVPPYLLLCGGTFIANFDCSTATGDYLNFGELSSQVTKSAATQLVLATNAASGYSVFVDGTTMTTGNSVIPALTTGDVSRPGTSQFGFNLVANSTPTVGNNPQGPGSGNVSADYAISNRYRFNPGEQVISAPGTSDYRKFTVSYIVNIGNAQAPGLYVTTLTYVAVASF
jgi:hypothetical protein